MSLTALNRDADTTVGFAVESCSLDMARWCTAVTESDPASVVKGDQPSISYGLYCANGCTLLLGSNNASSASGSVDHRWVNRTVLQASGTEGSFLMEFGNGPEKQFRSNAL